MSNGNMLCHLKASDFFVSFRYVPVIRAKNLTLVLINTCFLQPAIAPSRLIFAQGDTRRMSIIVDAGKLG